MWVKNGVIRIIDLSNGYYLIAFSHEDDKRITMENEPLSTLNHLIIHLNDVSSFFKTKYSFLWNSIHTLLGRYSGNPHLYLELFVSYTNIFFLLFLANMSSSLYGTHFIPYMDSNTPLPLVSNYTPQLLLPKPSFL